MSHRHDDADPVEHDPTGMRALLGSLPDPGPMPDHLVARITAALEEESRGGGEAVVGTTAAGDADPRWAPPPPAPQQLAAAAPAAPGHEGEVVPLRRRRTWVLGAAAAAVVALGVGGVVVDRLATGGLQASLGIAQGGDDSGAAESAAGGSADGAAEAPPLVAEDSALGVVVVATGSAYGPENLQDLAAALPQVSGTDASRLVRGEAVSEPLAGPAAARACAAGLGVAPDDAVTVDLATYEGRDAAVVVARDTGGAGRAWVVEHSCTATSPGIVQGPVLLP